MSIKCDSKFGGEHRPAKERDHNNNDWCYKCGRQIEQINGGAWTETPAPAPAPTTHEPSNAGVKKRRKKRRTLNSEIVDNTELQAAKKKKKKTNHLAKAKNNLAEARNNLAEATKQREVAWKRWQSEQDPKVKETFLSLLLDAARAVTDAQAAVTDAQAAVTRHLASLTANNGNGNEWIRVEQMDAYPTELLKAKHATDKLDKRWKKKGALSVGRKSRSGSVEHLGEGVYLARNTPAIDPDSALNPVTLTRKESRSIARAAVNAVLDHHRSKSKVVVVGQPGIGKTRGCLTAIIQELLSRGHDVLRVGLKNGSVYWFKPRPGNPITYTVWECTKSIYEWNKTAVARRENTVAVIDPPEEGGYTDKGRCKIIKVASNNSKRHFHNIHKDGVLLVTAMPTAAETAAATAFLWNGTTARPGAPKDPPFKDKVVEIRLRAKLVGWCWRSLFSWSHFIGQVASISREAEATARKFHHTQLMTFYFGKVTHCSSPNPVDADSRFFFLNPADMNITEDGSSRRTVPGSVVSLNPLASAGMRKQLRDVIEQWRRSNWEDFEEHCLGVLSRGTLMGLPPGAPLRPKTHEETYQLLATLPRAHQHVVGASTHFPVVDQFTDRYNLYNAKVGENATDTSASAALTFLLGGGYAEVDMRGKLKWKDSRQEKIPLTFLRNTGSTEQSYTHDVETTQTHQTKYVHHITSADVVKTMKKHFDTKFVNVSALPCLEVDAVNATLKTLGLPPIHW